MTDNEAGKNENPSLKEAMEALFEKESPFQKILINILCSLCVFIGINHMITSFHTYTPAYHCTDSNFSACDPQCPEITFESDVSTIVTEWSLICDRRYLSAMSSTLYFVGSGVGATFGGSLADRYGRKPVTLFCLYAQGVLGVVLFFVTRLELFIVVRMAQGFLIQSMGSSTYTLLSELCSRNWRAFMSAIWQTFFSLGLVYIAVADYFVQDWRWLEIVVSAPCLLTLLFIWAIPESPRWLLSKYRQEEALRSCKKLDKSFPDVKLSEETKGDAATPKSSNLDLFRNRILRKHLLINCVNLFSVTFSNYGIFYFLSDLVGNRHLNYVISSFIEIFFSVVAFFILQRFGRVYMTAFFQFGTALFLLLLGALSQFTTGQLWAELAISVLAQIGRGLTVGANMTVRLQCTETVPTIFRGNAFGIASSLSRIGSLLAPQMILLKEVSSTFVAMITYSVVLLAAGSGSLFLPETNNKQLPNTVEEAEEIWGKKKK